MYIGIIDFDDIFYKKSIWYKKKKERKINILKYLVNLFLLIVVIR